MTKKEEEKTKLSLVKELMLRLGTATPDFYKKARKWLLLLAGLLAFTLVYDFYGKDIIPELLEVVFSYIAFSAFVLAGGTGIPAIDAELQKEVEKYLEKRNLKKKVKK